MPTCPSDNRKVCLMDPNGANCIRIVRARVCKASNPAVCEPMQFEPLVPFVSITLPLPTARTLAKAQSLGLVPRT